MAKVIPNSCLEFDKTYEAWSLLRMVPSIPAYIAPHFLSLWGRENCHNNSCLEPESGIRLILSKETWSVVDNTFEEGQRHPGIRDSLKDSLKSTTAARRWEDEAPKHKLRKEKTQTSEAVVLGALITNSLWSLPSSNPRRITFSFPSSYLFFQNQTDPNLKPACPVTGHFSFSENPQPQQLLTDLLSLCGLWTSHSQSLTFRSLCSWQLLRPTTYRPCDISQTPIKGSSSFYICLQILFLRD